ncbi:prepilin-type N-terminal cleavage/methylation domain-containing protein [Lentisphaera marina]|uniref:type II secretion system protein n=1 Tax=Lentisphaera marina TaxID=1111041 RepID=UPI0023670EB7|nr:prepilin-type N-terminal cleavage/methylation domain-containing protein [Lentisphaera marina]MDD7986412.1 prepilin-type N-terminal cleavage/methylation domain-containing protein [Lentisphaera marina]
MTKKHFSLIELLVVIAVIGILFSLLAPALSSARESAKTATCKSTLKSLHTASLMYADDNNDVAIFKARQPGYDNYSPGWSDYSRLAQYLMDTGSEPDGYRYYNEKFLCPKADYARSQETNFVEGRPYELRFSYGMNTSNQVINKASQFAGVKFTQLNDPANKILFSDSISEAIIQNNAEYGMYLGGNYENPANNWNRQVAYRHKEQANTVFYDGHIGPVNHLQLTSNATDYWTLSGYVHISKNGTKTIVP